MIFRNAWSMCKFIFKNIVDYVIELSFRIFLSSIFDLPFKNPSIYEYIQHESYEIFSALRKERKKEKK